MSAPPPAFNPPAPPPRAWEGAGAGMPGAAPWDSPPSAHSMPGGSDADRPAAPPPLPEANSLFDRLADQPLRVLTVRLNGLKRTSRSLVERELQNLGSATTVGGVRDALLTDWEVLAGLGAFSTVELALEECNPPVPGACRVNATFVEKPVVSLNTGTYFQGTEMAAEVKVGLTNPTGHGEKLTLSVEKGSEALGELGANLSKPRFLGRPWTASADAHGRTRSWALSSSFEERSLGGGVRLTRDDGAHSLGYGAAWRTLADGTRHASGSVKAQAGHSLKSALSYTGRLGRTVGVGPAEFGAVASYSAEVAGLGLAATSGGGSGGGGGGTAAAAGMGLVRHVRQAVSASAHAPLAALLPSFFGPLGPGADVGRAVGLHVSASAGLLVPRGGSGGGCGGRPPTPTTSLSDRFFLGGFGGLAGSSTLRGFGLRGAGPVDARHVPALSPVRGADVPSSSSSAPPPPPPAAERPWDFLGGDAVGSLTAAARVALPWRWARETGIFGHAFVNGGGLALLGGSRGSGGSGGVLGAVRSAAADSRWSAGVGLVWPTVAGNLEVDWVHVVRAKPSDVARSGLSVGFTGRT